MPIQSCAAKARALPLAQSVERDLARSLLGEGAPDEVVDAVSEGAEGNPFFLEERLFSLLETGALVRGEGGGWSRPGRPGRAPRGPGAARPLEGRPLRRHDRTTPSSPPRSSGRSSLSGRWAR